MVWLIEIIYREKGQLKQSLSFPINISPIKLSIQNLLILVYILTITLGKIDFNIKYPGWIIMSQQSDL